MQLGYWLSMDDKLHFFAFHESLIKGICVFDHFPVPSEWLYQEN